MTYGGMWYDTVHWFKVPELAIDAGCTCSIAGGFINTNAEHVSLTYAGPWGKKIFNDCMQLQGDLVGAANFPETIMNNWS